MSSKLARNRRRWSVAFTAIAILGAVVAGPARGDALPGATRVVEQLHAALTDTMVRAEELGYEGRFAALEPVVTAAFDLEFMGQKSVGRNWENFDAEQKDRFRRAFAQYTVANYAGRFVGYSGQSFETRSEDPAPRDTVLVRTALIDPGSETIQLDYRLRAPDGNWKIIDVFMKGTISELALRRSQYTSILRRDGFESLMDSLNGKIRDFEAGDEADQNESSSKSGS